MKSLIRWMATIFHRSQYVTDEVAVSIIRGFIENRMRNPGDWDDLETVTHSNPAVKLAVFLCWYYAGEFPPRHENEYCAPQANPYFLAVADALEKGFLHSEKQAEWIELLEKKPMKLPEDLGRIITQLVQK